MEKLSLKEEVTFHIGDTLHNVKASDLQPETTLNTYLRQNSHLTGTKRMCVEGGCGACIVVVEEIKRKDGKRHIFAVNSCLVSIFSCHGWKIHTIEGIGQPGNYHALQKLLAENNGTQCGFCSSGMIMNMYALFESGPVTSEQIENSFGGNICRCTGYRPILTGFKKLTQDEFKCDIKDIEDLTICKKENCQNDCMSPFYLDLKAGRWVKVYSVKDLLQILKTVGKDSYMLVGGNTAKGVFKPTTSPDCYIDISSVNELINYKLVDNTLILGGNMTITKTMECFYSVAKEKKDMFSYLSLMADHLDLVASVPVRNIGTLAGNLMMKHGNNSFQSDVFLILETAKATMVVVDEDANESMVSPQDFLLLPMQKRVIKSIILNGLDSSYKYQSYKIMPRAQNAHAIVNAGFLFQLNGNIVHHPRIVYGSINPTFIHATKTEELLNQQDLFKNTTLQQVFKSLDDELKPDWVLPEPKPEYRKQLAIALFYKTVLKFAPKDSVSKLNQSGATILQRPLSSGTQEFVVNKEMYPVGEPIIKAEAMAQCSGEAQYVDDIHDAPNQLHGAFVLAKSSPNSVIFSIDPSEVLKMKGVVGYFDKRDIPGKNTFLPKELDFPQIEEELFCTGVVKYYHQPIGIVVATDRDLAEKAADLVQVTYQKSTVKPLITIQDVLKAKDTKRVKHMETIVPKSKGKNVKHVVKDTFNLGHQYHYHMELQCCNVIPIEDGLEIHASTQWMDLAQHSAAVMLNIPVNRINVIVRRLGGAYGGKITRNAIISTAAALAAYKTKKPVRMSLPLIHNMTVIGKRFPCYVEYEAGVDDDGKIQYLEADIYSDVGVGGNEVFPIIDSLENVYDTDTWHFSTYWVSTDTHANCYTRAPGTTEAMAAIETILDHVAYTVNKDPLEVKKININTKKFPNFIPKYLNDINTWANIAKRKTEIDAFNKANRWKKRGMSVVPMAWTLDIFGSFSVRISIFHGDGTVAILHGGVEMGQGINTKVMQVVAYKFGIPIEKVMVKPSFNMITPNDFATGGSLGSEAIALGAIKACDILLERMKPIKEKLGKDAKWVDIVKKCHAEFVELGTSSMFKAPEYKSYQIFGACATEVEVDILTGQHLISRVDILEDVGNSINPFIDIGQIEGAFVMGAGYFTSEEIVYNDQGEILTNRTWNYKPPGVKDIPIDFRIKFPANNPNELGVLKTKAVAEPPFCLSVTVPLAIRNAIASARSNANNKESKWFKMDGPTSFQNSFLNSLNNYQQYVL